MKEIIFGIISGIIAATGMGGGTILIFLLNTVSGIEQHIAQATNLVYFVPTAISAIIVNYREKNIEIKLAKNVIIFFSPLILHRLDEERANFYCQIFTIHL